MAKAVGLAYIYHPLIRDLGHLHGCPRNWVINTLKILQWNKNEVFIPLTFKTTLHLVRRIKIFLGISSAPVAIFQLSSKSKFLNAMRETVTCLEGNCCLLLL